MGARGKKESDEKKKKKKRVHGGRAGSIQCPPEKKGGEVVRADLGRPNLGRKGGKKKKRDLRKRKRGKTGILHQGKMGPSPKRKGNHPFFSLLNGEKKRGEKGRPPQHLSKAFSFPF